MRRFAAPISRNNLPTHTWIFRRTCVKHGNIEPVVSKEKTTSAFCTSPSFKVGFFVDAVRAEVFRVATEVGGGGVGSLAAIVLALAEVFGFGTFVFAVVGLFGGDFG